MKNKLNFSIEALKDMDEIWDYIAIELAVPETAKKVINEILNCIDRLENFAEMGAPLSSKTDIITDYRYLLSGSYLIFYRAEEANVYVDRAIYGKRDYLRILFPEALEEI